MRLHLQPTPEHKSRTVLLVEDEPEYQKLVILFSRNTEWKVLIADTPRSMRALLNCYAFDVLLVDNVRDEDLDAFTLAGELFKGPVVKVSAAPDRRHGVVEKPYTKDRLLNLLNNAIQQKVSAA